MGPKRLGLTCMTAVACLGWLAPVAADQLDDVLAARKLRVAIINGLPNFSYMDKQRRFVGSDVETATLLARDLGVAVEFVQVPNADRIDTLLSKRADIIVSALSITPQREQVISFSLPYSQIALVIAAPKRMRIDSYADLNGKRVGVGSNTSNGEQLRKYSSEAQLAEYPDEHSLIAGYVKGEFDIISAQRADIDEINRLAPERHLEEKFVQREFEVAIGIRKNERRLRNRINDWIASNLANGTLNDLFRRYHGRDLPESVMPKPIAARAGS